MCALFGSGGRFYSEKSMARFVRQAHLGRSASPRAKGMLESVDQFNTGRGGEAWRRPHTTPEQGFLVDRKVSGREENGAKEALM